MVFTDHKTLEHWLRKEPVTDAHARMIVKLQDFEFVIRYIKDEDNVLTDFASRPTSAERATFDELRKELDDNGVHGIMRMDLKRVVIMHEDLTFAREDPRLKEERVIFSEGVFWYSPKPGDEAVLLIPPGLREQLIADVHQMAHSGSRRCVTELRRSCFWPGLYAPVQDYIANCDHCLKRRRAVKPKYPMQHIVCTGR